MKGRIIKSSFWESRVDKKYAPSTAYFYLYLLSSRHIGLTPYFKLPKDYIPLETGLTVPQIDKAIEELHAKKQVYFYDGWVFIPNADEHNSYKSSPKTRVAYEIQLKEVPSHVLAFFDTLVDKDDTLSIEYPYSTDTHNSNNNSNSDSNNRGIVKGEAEQVLEKWNAVFKTNFTSTTSIEKNLAEWLKEYSLEQILQGIETAKLHHFWSDKINPTTYLRHKNPRGEDVDYIAEMLNYKPKKEFANASSDDKYKNL